MINLFEFEKVEVRTVKENGKIWFSGQDVFKVLGLTWRGSGGVEKQANC
jgi:prophage antirepressor-like protein